MREHPRSLQTRLCGALLAGSVGILLAGASAAADAGAGKIAYLAWSEGGWQVWTMAADGSGARQVTRSPGDKTRLSWFPDGRRLLVNAVDGSLSIADVATGRETPLAMPLRGMIDAALSPEGERIAFSLSTAESRDDNEIYVIGLDGKRLHKLTDMKWLQHEPTWSSDGDWLYFLSGDGKRDHDVWRISLDGRKREQLTAGAYFHFEPALAPDGRIAFSNNVTGDYEVYVQVPGGGVQRVTHEAGLDGHPTWSPDGRSLVIHSVRSGRLNLWHIDLETGEARQLTDHATGARSPEWWHPHEAAP